MNLLNIKTLNEHAQIKKNFLQANHVPYMTKLLRKAIMPWSELESKYLKNSTIENKTKYKNYCKRLQKKRTEIFLLKFRTKSDNK